MKRFRQLCAVLFPRGALLALCGLSLFAQTQLPPVSIVDVVPARLNTSIPDENGDFPAVITLRNNNPRGGASIDLGGWFLSDDSATPAKWQFPEKTVIAAQGQLIVFASGKDRRPPGGDGRLHSNFTYPCDVPFAGLYDPKPTLVSEYSKRDPGCVTEECRGNQIFTRNTLARFFVPRDGKLDSFWTLPNFDDSKWEQGPLGLGYDSIQGSSLYSSLIGTDVLKQMRGINPSIYIRIPFTLTNAAIVGNLALSINYDDGFVAYLNGIEVARRNTPNAVDFSSAAATDRTDSAALTAEIISLAAKLGVLNSGQNLLAIQGLNAKPDAERFVVRPQLCVEIGETRDCPKTSRGRDFWIAFPGNAPADTNNPLRLTVCITGPSGTSGQVEIPGLGFAKAYTIPANGPVAGTGTIDVELDPNATLDASGVIEPKGVHITANRDVAVYATSRIDYSTDTFLALPTECLGTDYLALGYKNVWTNLDLLNGTEFALVAVFDGTRVTINPSRTSAGGAPFDIILNRGETYLLRNTANAPADLSGASITSNVRIGVFAGHRCANINGKDIFFCNLNLEQLLPLNAWGTQFVTAPFRTRTQNATQKKGDTIRIVAAQTNTLVTITDSTASGFVTLNAGQVHEQIVVGPANITARGPILVAQYSNSSDFDSVVNSDPFMSLVQPVARWLNRYLVCAPATLGGTADFETNYVNIIARTDDVALIRLNGAPVQGFLPTGLLGLSYAQVVLDSSLNGQLIDSPRGAQFAVTVYGYSEYDAYGYPGGFGFAQAVPVSIVCPPDMLIPVQENCSAPAPDLRRQIVVRDPCDDGSGQPVEECFDFEDLKLATEYKVGDTFTTSGGSQTVPVTVAPFFFSNGQSTSNGFARVVNGGQAGHSGNEIMVNNVNLVFRSASTWSGLSIRYGEYGGNINLSVNGVRRNESDFSVLNGATIGGCTVTVLAVAGTPFGEIRISGTVTEFAIGGQELFVDHLCVNNTSGPPPTSCFDFEDLKPQSVFRFGDTFTTASDSGESITATVAPFFFSNGGSTTNGTASVRTGGQAGHTGQELAVNNVRLVFKPANPWPSLSILYGEFGGNINLSVNGEVRNEGDFTTLNGATIGGAQVTVIPNGTRGEIRIVGSIREFDIGGQELFIDHLCRGGTNQPPAGSCIEFDSLKLQTIARVGQSFTAAEGSDSVEITISPFVFSSGQVTSNGTAVVTTGGRAGSSGNEIQVNNVNLFFKPSTTIAAFSILYGEFGGNINLAVNGARANASDFFALNQTNLGGAMVAVTTNGSRGEIRVVGTIRDFAVGGQELFVDHLCLVKATSTIPGARLQAASQPAVSVTQTPPPGTSLPIGEHEISAVIRSASGALIGACTTRVTVQDLSPVVMECPKEVAVPCESPRGAIVHFEEQVRAFTEKCGVPIALRCEPPSGSLFPPGTTTVRCVGRDPQGELITCTFPVTVRCGAPSLAVSVLDDRRLRFDFPSGALLQAAPTVLGPWQIVTNFASGDTLRSTNKAGFYRLIIP